MWREVLKARDRYGYCQLMWGWQSTEAEDAKAALISRLREFADHLTTDPRAAMSVVEQPRNPSLTSGG